MTSNDFVNPSISLSADECELLIYYDKVESTFCLWSKKDGELLNISVEEALKFSEFVQHASNEKTTNSALPKNQTFDSLSDVHQRILEAIEAQENGITFSDLCNELNMKTAELQGYLGSLTSAWRIKTGSDERPWTVKNKKYFVGKNVSNEEPTKYQQRMEKLKSEFPNAYAKWTSEEERALKKIWKETGSIEAISNALGRHRGSIRSRLGKLGLDALSLQFEQQEKEADEQVDDSSSVAILDEDETYCRKCGLVIPIERMKVLPDTQLCVDCASDPNFKKQKVPEPWGSREDFKKDRKSWLRWRRD
ncbi:TraR/DksA C4-type zinc finger protein [Paracoccaceae bacterium]|nr:TraR/DksA C4-type zinc finger protein [Paracoccaceae bacterium]